MVINIMKEFKEWLDLYGRAWMLRKPTLIKKLFVDNATYHEKPLEKPLKGISEITKYWENVSKLKGILNSIMRFCHVLKTMELPTGKLLL